MMWWYRNIISGVNHGVFRYQSVAKPVVLDNTCKKLAPRKYIENEARVFSDAELQVENYSGNEALIPNIIHQTWDTYDIPQPAVQYVRSIVERHPHWEYWFWTADDIRCYMKTFHSEYLKLFDSYDATIYRTDVMRYFLLYDFGGFYIDLDVKALRPLDVWRFIAPCVLSHETYEHTYFAHSRNQPNVMTTILASRPGHPYFKLLQEQLQLYHDTCPHNVLYSTGPFYIDNVYQLFAQSQAHNGSDSITIIHPRLAKSLSLANSR